ncbi:DUF1819 family protein [Mesorhizobium sp.]|uniref:DUF1819 family protein n=1 Tax=Mesorhizobium sp. TaxID=1871066 RepID=UPI000FE5331A|nr:DUF1819 family protein [Mesorhizobium sp.]RWM08013.1 MAG: DUF1819 family protein [Mesorhizobium sp.]
MSFAVGGLFRNESVEAARLYQQLKYWDAVREELVGSGTFRTGSSAKRTVREMVDRLRALSGEETDLLIEGTPQEQAVLLWLAVCRTYRFVAEFATEMLRERFLSFRVDLDYAAFDAFFEAKAEWNSELAAIRPSTRAKLRQVLFRIMREADIISPSDEIRRTLLTPRLQSLIAPAELRWLPGVDERAGVA